MYVYWCNSFNSIMNMFWELESMVTFRELLYSFPVSKDTTDSVCWQPSTRKDFEVKSYYQVLHPSTRSLFPWKSWVPTKVAFFIWTATLGKILTTDILWKRAWLLWIGVVFVTRQGNLSVICFFIVWLLRNFGIWCSLCLGSPGLCQGVWWSFWVVGKAKLVGANLVSFKRWFHCILCGVYGVWEMQKLLKEKRKPCQWWNLLSSSNSTDGWRPLIMSFLLYVWNARLLFFLYLIFFW